MLTREGGEFKACTWEALRARNSKKQTPAVDALQENCVNKHGEKKCIFIS